MRVLFIIFFFFSFFCFSQDQQFSLNYAKKEFNKGNYNKVIEYHLENKKRNQEVQTIELIAECYDKIDDFFKAIKYYEKAIKLNKEANNKTSLLSNYMKIAVIHKKIQKKQNYKIAVNYLLKANSLTKEINVSIATKNVIHNNLANYYNFLEQIENALFHHKKALKLALINKDSIQVARSYSNIAALYLNANSSKKELDKAKHYITKSLKYNPEPHYGLFKNLGIANYLNKNYENALRNHNKAIESLLGNNLFNSKNLPDLETIKSSNKKRGLIAILYEKTYAWIKYAEQENNKQFLEEALNTIELTDKILDLLFIETTEEKTKIYWRRRAADFYFLGVHISYLLNNNKKVFYFTEKNKALLLLNNTTATKLNYNIKLPDSIKKKEIELKKEIYQLETLVNRGKNLDSLKNKLFEKKLDFDYFLKSLKKEFPKYTENNKKQTKRLSLKEFQNKITDTSKCYINYLWNKNENQFFSLYGIAITKDSVISFKIDDLEKFDEKVLKFKKIVAEAFINTKEKKDYQNIAFSLYQDLFPIKIRPLIKNKKLIIIPDSDLANIPFEALITNANTNNYLIKKHVISYAYSLSFLLENSILKRNPKNNFISFAPITFNYDNLETLNNSKTEVNDIKSIVNGEVVIDIDATKQKFFSKINNYKIIHLSTHANANDSIAPWIAFKNEKLYLNELYTTKNQADLVVLSACNSSLGKIKDGEGVFSLARGFFYSGSKSVISSLWNVNDKSNATITTSFYTYLKSGETKSAALRQAKLDYLDTHSLSEVSPYYWSSLILIGDDTSLEFNNNYLLYIVLTILLLFVLFFVLKKLKTVGNKS